MLANAIWSLLPDQGIPGLPRELQYVLDGGALLQRIPWEKGASYIQGDMHHKEILWISFLVSVLTRFLHNSCANAHKIYINHLKFVLVLLLRLLKYLDL